MASDPMTVEPVKGDPTRLTPEKMEQIAEVVRRHPRSSRFLRQAFDAFSGEFHKLWAERARGDERVAEERLACVAAMCRHCANTPGSAMGSSQGWRHLLPKGWSACGAAGIHERGAKS